MKKWEIKSVIAPDLIGVKAVREEEEKKLYALLEKGFEPFAVLSSRIWLRLKPD